MHASRNSELATQHQQQSIYHSSNGHLESSSKCRTKHVRTQQPEATTVSVVCIRCRTLNKWHKTTHSGLHNASRKQLNVQHTTHNSSISVTVFLPPTPLVTLLACAVLPVITTIRTYSGRAVGVAAVVADAAAAASKMHGLRVNN